MNFPQIFLNYSLGWNISLLAKQNRLSIDYYAILHNIPSLFNTSFEWNDLLDFLEELSNFSSTSKPMRGKI